MRYILYPQHHVVHVVLNGKHLHMSSVKTFRLFTFDSQRNGICLFKSKKKMQEFFLFQSSKKYNAKVLKLAIRPFL